MSAFVWIIYEQLDVARKRARLVLRPIRPIENECVIGRESEPSAAQADEKVIVVCRLGPGQLAAKSATPCQLLRKRRRRQIPNNSRLTNLIIFIVLHNLQKK